MSVRYSLENAPQGRNDGSGYVDHDIMAQDDSGGDWEYVPGYHKTFVVPYDEIDVVMAMPDGTAQERQAKNAAYKDLMVLHANDVASPLLAPAPPTTNDWTQAGIEQYISDYNAWLITYQDWLDNTFDPINTAADQSASDLNEYITVTLGQSYPVGFRLDLEI